MRNLVVVAVMCLAATWTARAESLGTAGPLTIEPLNKSFVETMVERGASGRRIEPNVVAEFSDSIFIFPVVGNAPGSRGSYFRSETTIANNRNIPQDIAMFYYPSGGGPTNCSRDGILIRQFPANSWRAWNDFVGEVFGVTGLGTVIVAGVDANGQADTNALLDGTSRIYTPVPGTTGQASQSFPGVAINVQPGATAQAWGLRHDPTDFRTNIGVVNYDFLRNLRRTFDLTVVGSTGLIRQYSVDVDACNLAFFNLPPSDNFGLLNIAGFARDGGALWYGFGASNDNATGDSWSVVMHTQ